MKFLAPFFFLLSLLLPTEAGSTRYETGAKIKLQGGIAEDVVATGAKIFIDAVISGNATLTSGIIDFRGQVSGDMTANAGNIAIDGIIDGELSASGGSVTFKHLTKVYGPAVINAGTIKATGEFHSNVTYNTGVLHLDGSYDKDLKIESDEIHLSPSFKVKGNLTYRSPEKISGIESYVLGKVTYTPKKKGKTVKFNLLNSGQFEALTSLIKNTYPFSIIPQIKFKFIGTFWFLFSFFILGACLFLFSPKVTFNAIEMAQKLTFKSFLLGWIFSIVFPVFFILLCFTFIGIPLAIIFSFLYILFGCAGVIISALMLGDFLSLKISRTRLTPKNKKHFYITLFLSLLGLSIAYKLLPLALLLHFILYPIGFGAWLAVFYNHTFSRS